MQGRARTTQDRDSKRKVCRECHLVFSRDLDFWEHLVQHKGNFGCNQCQKRFQNLSQIAMHLAKPHLGEDQVMTCKICNRNFGSKPILDQHINLHFNVRPFICKVCKRRFAKEVNLKLHEKNVHKTGPKVNQSALGSMSGSPVLVDRVETPEKEECRLSGKTPLAVFKSGDDHVLVSIISAFPTKDLLVPVPADDLPAYLMRQEFSPTESPDESELQERLVSIVAVVERIYNLEGQSTLNVSRPTMKYLSGFPVSMLSFLQVKQRFGEGFGQGRDSNREPRVPNVKIFRTEVSEKFLSRRLKDSEKLECHFVDIADFGGMKLDLNI